MCDNSSGTFDHHHHLFHQDILVTNVKISVKLKQSWDLKDLYEHCFSKICNHVKLLGSKLVVKVPNQAKRIIIFPKKAGTPFQHINVTGISTLDQIDKALEIAAFYLDRKKNDFLHFKIDNIWAKSDIIKKHMEQIGINSLNLKKLIAVIRETSSKAEVALRFCPEIFSPIIFRGYNATTLIYSTGAVVIIGAKEYKTLLTIIKILEEIDISSSCQI